MAGYEYKPLTTSNLASPTIGPSSIAGASIAASIKAADQRARLGVNNPGNVITKNAFRPITAESDELQARLNARRANPQMTTIQAATDAPMTPGTESWNKPTSRYGDLPPSAQARTVIPVIGSAQGSAGVNGAATSTTETPWWQKSSFDSGFQKFINENRGDSNRDPSLTSRFVNEAPAANAAPTEPKDLTASIKQAIQQFNAGAKAKRMGFNDI